MSMNPVGWFEIYVQDLERAAKFYEAVFQVELTKLVVPGPEVEMMTFPMNPEGKGASGAIAKMDKVPSGGNSVMVYFSCDDCAVEASRIDPAGGKLVQPKFSIGEHGFIAIASDPDGNMIGLHSRA